MEKNRDKINEYNRQYRKNKILKEQSLSNNK